MSTEAVFLTLVIDAYEDCYVVTVDIPGTFMHADMDEIVYMKLEGVMAELLVRVHPEKYGPYMTVEHGRKVIYVQLLKALYGTLQAALLFWQNLSSFLIDVLGFVPNQYDSCVVNKMINGKQCTIGWHVDDLKISHVNSAVVEDIVSRLNDQYGKEEPISMHRGKVHDYLGMQLDFTQHGKLVLSMIEYIKNVLSEAPDDMQGTASTPASAYLFDVNLTCAKLNPTQAEQFHHITAQLLYLCKRARPHIQTAVAYLCTHVSHPDVDDWKKLGWCVQYLHGTIDLPLTLEIDGTREMKWWIDASYAVHQDMCSLTGVAISLGKGALYSSSTRQKINTKSSTEAKLVGVSDALNMVIWTRNFLNQQGFDVSNNIVYQDNQSAILLETNGRASSGHQTVHMNICYFCVTDHINQGELQIEYCPTDDMLGDFFTKPLQGAWLKQFRRIILNLETDVALPITTTRPQECVETPRVCMSPTTTGTHQTWPGDKHGNEVVSRHAIHIFWISNPTRRR